LIENILVWAKWHRASSTFGLIKNILVWSKLHHRAPKNLDWTKNSLVWSKLLQRVPIKFGLNKNSLVWSKWHQRTPKNNKVHTIAENYSKSTSNNQYLTHYNCITTTIHQISHSNLSQFLIYLKQIIMEESLRLLITSPPHPNLLA